MRRHSAAPPPVARTVARAAIGPASVTTPAHRLPSLHRASAEVSSSTWTRSLGGDPLRQAAGDRAPRLGAAGMNDPARRVAALESEAQAAVRLGVEAHPAPAKLLDRRRRLASERLDRLGAAEAAAGVQGVVGVAGG